MNNNKNSDDKKKKMNNFGGFGKDPNSGMRSMIIWLIIIGTIFSVYIFTGTQEYDYHRVTYSEYQKFLEQELISKAIIEKSDLNDFVFKGELKQPVSVTVQGQAKQITRFSTKLGVLDSETEKLWESKGISWTYKDGNSRFWSVVISFLPWVLLIGIYIFLVRRMQGGGSKGIFSFGKSKAKLLNENDPKVTFEDVAGADEAKYELEEVIEFLKEPAKFQKLGGKIPRGVLLLGPPGTGKTLLARAVAGEAGVPFYTISGADFVEMFVGVGASRVRDLFDQAKKNSPCIVFIDEIDAVGRHRGAGVGGGHDEREQTLNQLLVEMDGFEQNSGVIIIAATNRPDVLDPALLRPGRFDRQVVVDRPDVKGRVGILKVHTNKIPLGDDVNLDILAKGTPGLSGADIANIVNEAALLAARRDSEKVTMYDFENAKDKILMGIERKSMVISEKEKEITAYHEMGHALVGRLLPNTDSVHKVTIIPRGRALGVTSFLPDEEFHSKSKEYLLSTIAMALAGRVAENLIFGIRSTGASNDLQRATHIAKKMVCEWGMSDEIGPVSYQTHSEEVFLGKEMAQPKDHSESTALIIDKEIKNIILEANDKAEKILTDNIDILHNASKLLLEREVLDAEELDIIIKGEEIPPINKSKINAMRSMSFNNKTNNNQENKKEKNEVNTDTNN
jgi:cell division protease FtsH